MSPVPSRFPFSALLRAALAGAILTPFAALAADTDDFIAVAPSSESHWGLGLGANVARSPYTGVGNKTTAIPLIMYENRYVNVLGNAVDLKLPSVGQFDFALRAKLALGAGYKDDDAAELAGMAERKGSIWVGAATTWNSPLAKLSLEWLGDASSYSKGQTVKLGAERSWRSGRTNITPHLSATWMDDKYVDYYYGVLPQEATAARPAYTGKSTTEVQLGVRVDYALRPNQILLFDASYTHFGSAISDSPLVDKTSAPSIRLGYLYRF